MLDDSATPPTLIQSLQRGMHLVAAVTEHGPLTARALSERTGICLPTTYHLLRTLVHEGYLQREADGCYGLGRQLTFVTQLESRARSLRLVREEMADLAAEGRVTVSIAALVDDDIVISQFVTHSSVPRFDCWPGMAIPGHATAIGKNILSRMPPAQLAHYLSSHPLRQFTAQTVTVDWRLTEELSDAAVIHNDQQYQYGLSCAATALSDEGLSAIGAAYSSDRSQRQRDRVDGLLAAAAQRISAAMDLVRTELAVDSPA